MRKNITGIALLCLGIDNLCLEMSKENLDQTTFVSIHYIICECGETFPSEDALKEHLEKEHPHKREKKEYRCGICSAIYSTEEECIVHYENSHMLPASSDRDDSEDGEDEKLDMPLDQLNEAIEAIKQETHEDGDTLEEGEIPVKKVKGRRNTNKTVTDGEVVFVIQHGEMKGKLVNMLKKSGRLSNGKKNCACEVCGKLYASHAALRYHQRTHTGERPYRCTVCPKAFTMPLFLQIHTRTHTGERPYQCPHCPKAFSNKAALLRHDRVHTGEKPYQCPMCPKTFTQSNSMKLHVTTVHLKQPTPYKSKHRKQREEERLNSKKKIINNPRKKVPLQLDSVEVLKNGLESYVLGPLKTDIDNLKSDIDMLARGEFEEQMAVEMIEKRERDYEEILYEETGEQYEVVLSDHD